jgi:hypothetical protein
MSEKPYKHTLGTINLLDATNYATWKRDCRRILEGVMAWEIVVGGEQQPNNPVGFISVVVAERAVYKDYMQRRAQAAAIIYGSCSTNARVHLEGITNPAEMWTALAARMDGANNAVGRMTLCIKFNSLRPTAGLPINSYFAQLLEIRNQLAGSAEAISDSSFKTHVVTTLPSIFAVTVEILQSRGNITIEEVIDALKECEKNKAMVITPDAVSEALCTQEGGSGGRGGYRGGRGREQKPWCTLCKTRTHTTDNCWTKGRKSNKRIREDQGSATAGCYYCGEEGHIKFDCPVRTKGNALRNSLKNAEHGDRLKPDDNPQ